MSTGGFTKVNNQIVTDLVIIDVKKVCSENDLFRPGYGGTYAV